MKRPVAWSIWPSISSTAAMAVSRTARFGCSTGLALICSSTSGEALNRMPSREPAGRTKIDDCVRAFARTAPLRTPAQLRQLQFHCGKPPPAAEPRMVMCMVNERRPGAAGASRGSRLAQRAATYRVISKPKRKSTAVGVCHCMGKVSWIEGGAVPAGGRGDLHPATHVPAMWPGAHPVRSGIAPHDFHETTPLPGARRGSRYHADMPLAVPHPDLPPLRSRMLPVVGGQRLCVEEFGREHGMPAVVLHGGPGSGCSPLLRRFFDPARWRIVCIDQRGAGRSEPRGGVVHNTTADLLADLRAVREALRIDRWLVVGGSWGATLAILHAHDDPGAASGLLLRSSFLARASDIDGFFADAPLPLREGWRRLPGLPARAARHIARDWWRWEHAFSGKAGAAPEPDAAALDALVGRYRVQSHYLAHGCFLTQPLADTAAALPTVPTQLLHGREDRVCPVDGAALLHERMPHAVLRWIDGVGHDPAHPAMSDAMVRALDGFAAHGRFAR